MANPRVTADVEFPEGQSRFAKAIMPDWEPALREVGAFIASKIQRAFREQRRGGHNWPERSTPNLAGIIKDFERGGVPAARRFESRPAGVDTGTLMRSITFRVEDAQSVVIGTNVPYAKKIHEGGESVIPITDAVKDGISEWMKKADENTPGLARIRGLLKKDELRVDVRARPFMLVTEEEMDTVRDILMRAIGGGS